MNKLDSNSEHEVKTYLMQSFSVFEAVTPDDFICILILNPFILSLFRLFRPNWTTWQTNFQWSTTWWTRSTSGRGGTPLSLALWLDCALSSCFGTYLARSLLKGNLTEKLSHCDIKQVWGGGSVFSIKYSQNCALHRWGSVFSMCFYHSNLPHNKVEALNHNLRPVVFFQMLWS